jgi:acyl-coenzyme A synthetase/AMP-(fatty) acid ligase
VSASSTDTATARHPALRLLYDAIEATARTEGTRAALYGNGGAVTYGELCAALSQSCAGEARRRSLAMSGVVHDVVHLLREGCAGHSMLLLDAAGTEWELARTRRVFGEGGAGPDVPLIGLCTSGTNGLPKVVEIDWESALDNAASFSRTAGFRPDDVIWVTTPLPHLYGLFGGVMAGLLAGATVLVTPGAVGPEEFSERLAVDGVSVLLCVPFLARQYVQELRRQRELAAGRRLRATIAAGETVSEDLIAAWREATGTPLLSHYGITESGHMTLAAGRPGEGVGRPLPDVEVRIDGGGQVQVRRLAPARPYSVIGQPGGPEGWFVTGDLGHLDERGNLHLTGRANERINVAGKKVDPTEVEQALLALGAVDDCAVAGVRRGNGEQVVAFVTGADDRSDMELRAELGSLLSTWKLPRRFVRVASIPRTLTGKVRRGQLVADLESGTSHERREDSHQ